MQTFFQDLRYGARMLLKHRGFTLVALLTLALGIGANTAIFSVVNAVLLRPLPYAEPERLVAIGGMDAHKPGVKDSSSYPDFFDWRMRNQSFEAIAAYHQTTLTLTGADAPAHLSGQVVTAELFDVLKTQPLLGRNFTRADEKLGGADVAMELDARRAIAQDADFADISGKGYIVCQAHRLGAVGLEDLCTGHLECVGEDMPIRWMPAFSFKFRRNRKSNHPARRHNRHRHTHNA